MKILIISGSPRKKSYTRLLAKLAYEEAKINHEADLLDLGLKQIENFKGFEEKYDAYTKKIISSMKDYDSFIICSPVYNGAFSSAIKNLFEHLDYKAFEGKTAGYIVMGSGKISYLQVFGQLVALTAYFNITSNPKGISVSPEDFNEKMKIKNTKIKERIRNLIEKTTQIKV